jgi:hypothetical protein
VKVQGKLAPAAEGEADYDPSSESGPVVDVVAQ